MRGCDSQVYAACLIARSHRFQGSGRCVSAQEGPGVLPQGWKAMPKATHSLGDWGGWVAIGGNACTPCHGRYHGMSSLPALAPSSSAVSGLYRIKQDAIDPACLIERHFLDELGHCICMNVKIKPPGTTGFSHCFHLPGCDFGYLFLEQPLLCYHDAATDLPKK